MGNLCCKTQDKKLKEKAETKADGIETDNKKEPAKNDRKKAPTSEDTSKHSKTNSPDDHEDTQSETTDSDSSDSSCDSAKKSKHGNVTVNKSSKKIVKGNKYKIDNSHGKLHIGDIGKQIVMNKERVKIFKNAGYNAKNAMTMERKLWESISTTDSGSFINTRGKRLVLEPALNLQKRAEALPSVGILKYRNISGTCFRVGANKIMTALHVIKRVVDYDYTLQSIHRKRPSEMFESGHQASDDTETDGADASTHDRAVLMSLVDAFVDFHFLRDDHIFPDGNKFKLKPLTSVGDIPFFDGATDCIVLELLENDQGTPMPNSFTYFSIPQLDGSFHLIGHPGGKGKHLDQVTTVIDPSKEETQADLNEIQNKSKDFIRAKGKSVRDFPYDFKNGNDRVDNPHRFLFHCCFGKGASGSPGVVVDDDGRVIVMTMLLHGYPDWYYGPASEPFKHEWLQEHCVEQGANMIAVFSKMYSTNRTLYCEIFPNTT